MLKTHNKFTVLSAVVISLGAAGCAGVTAQKKEQLIDREGIDIVGSPADRTMVVINDRKRLERFCKGPGPDVATTATSGVNLGLKGVGAPAGGSIGEEAGRGAMDLGGRSPAVLLARELLYRSCELILNTGPDTPTAITIYKMTVDAIERIAALQTGSGVAASSAAPPKATVGLPNTITGSQSPYSAPASTGTSGMAAPTDAQDTGSGGTTDEQSSDSGGW